MSGPVVRATIDGPAERGGTNQGPTPSETLKNGVAIQSMNIRLEAQFDRRGVTLEEEIDVPFPSVTLHIDLVTDADAAGLGPHFGLRARNG